MLYIILLDRAGKMIEIGKRRILYKIKINIQSLIKKITRGVKYIFYGERYTSLFW
jgi:hypothetical protein